MQFLIVNPEHANFNKIDFFFSGLNLAQNPRISIPTPDTKATDPLNNYVLQKIVTQDNDGNKINYRPTGEDFILTDTYFLRVTVEESELFGRGFDLNVQAISLEGGEEKNKKYFI